ncbi:hypothetical protein P8C59_000819 [Phyllachora maydis]|uniref:RING-type domain-containing protein n=1 Tax=Phyllachora maydis TaxID=1825666 RepID=A0AAD9MBL2_9PEZI|nr:hypothetical protein P8C59_000819 [Phyllachora maydis]
MREQIMQMPFVAVSGGDFEVAKPQFIRGRDFSIFHEHGDSEGTKAMGDDGPVRPSTRLKAAETVTRGCRDCSQPLGPRAWHMLPCGHLLCGACLSKVASGLPDAIGAHVDALDQMLAIYEPGLDAALPAHARRGGRLTAADLGVLRADAAASARALVGLACCGVDFAATARRFAGCLDVAAARHLRAACAWLVTPPSGRLVCAWPDCGAFLSDGNCFPADPRVALGDGEERWHCFACGGNSRIDENVREEDQAFWPFAKVGTAILWPAR